MKPPHPPKKPKPQIAAFHTDEFWPGPLYHDADRAFYKVFSDDGKSVRTQSVLSL
jgi:hypothetical protein